MNEVAAREWLFSTQLFGMKLGLENMARLCEALGHPERDLAFVHVAGTNGKGTTCAFIEAIARAHGMRTGLYTSPHLVDVRERFQVDRRLVSGEEFAFHAARVRAAVSTWEPHPTFFEITTAMALLIFQAHAVDLAVWETGLGGRLDATNVVTPQCSVLTVVDLDHSRWLGDTPGAVAVEKAGIIKRGVPVVSAKQLPEVEAVFAARAVQMETAVVIAPPFISDGDLGTSESPRAINAGLALGACQAAGLRLDPDVAARAIASARWPGRWHQIGGVLVDGAHNPHALSALAAEWRRRFPMQTTAVVFGAASDKDIGGGLLALAGVPSEWHFVRIPSSRSAEPEDLARTAAQVLPGVPAQCHRSLKQALASAGSAVAKGGTAPVLVTGSLFLAGETLGLLGWNPEGS